MFDKIKNRSRSPRRGGGGGGAGRWKNDMYNDYSDDSDYYSPPRRGRGSYNDYDYYSDYAPPAAYYSRKGKGKGKGKGQPYRSKGNQ